MFVNCNLFCDCANGSANIFNVNNDFNTAINFIKFLNFKYSSVEVNFDVSYNGNCNFNELISILKCGRSGSNKNTIVIFIFFDKIIFLFAAKTKNRVKIIQKDYLEMFFLYWLFGKRSSTLHHDIFIIKPITLFTIELINKVESQYTSHLHLQSVFLSVSQIKRLIP